MLQMTFYERTPERLKSVNFKYFTIHINPGFCDVHKNK